jgi:hypothetical protein
MERALATFSSPARPAVYLGIRWRNGKKQLRMLSRRSMRLFGAALAICLALTACKKKAQLVAPAAQEAAKATPASSATPLREPVNLKSQVIVLCYHRFDDNPKDSLAIKPADFEAQMQALKGAVSPSSLWTISWLGAAEKKGSLIKRPSSASMTDTFRDTKWLGRSSRNSAIPLRCSFTRTT